MSRVLHHYSLALLALCALALAGGTCALDAANNPGATAQVLAPFYTGLDYDPPLSGTYTLPPLGKAADGKVLDENGNSMQLHDLFQDRVVLLSFIYSTCTDANGCPLATAVMYKLRHLVAEAPELRDRFRMVSLSFDPEYDTPEVMRLFGSSLDRTGTWRFLTTASREDLEPILDAYRQSVIQDFDEQGNPLPSFSHILRVFLIDQERRIRNIYSVAFLYPELILNDVRTVLAERDGGSGDGTRGVVATAPVPQTSVLAEPGDYKQGYESAGYRTRSKAMELRTGEPADLVRFVRTAPLGLPQVPVPPDNPITRARVDLGRQLFFDRRLSLNDTFSCAMCHVPEQGFTSNEMATAVGVEGRSVRRNAPTVYNVAYAERLFHDGREDTLEQQVWGPLLAKNEMANPSVGYVLRKIRALPEYQGRFEAAFAGRGPAMETLGMALAAYQRTLNSANSPFDRWRYGGEEPALGESARRGFDLFAGKAGCSACHLVGPEHALFTDNRMHNTGIGYRESMGIRPETHRIAVAPGVFVDVDSAIIDTVSEDAPADLGLYEITQDPADRWKYKTPSLRNVALTAPYMHNGSLGTLEQVVLFYNRGGVPNDLLDPLIRPLNLTYDEIADLVAFLGSLTGDNVDTLVADAFAAPVGDVNRADLVRVHGDGGGH